MIDRLGEVIAKRMVADGDRSVLIEVGRPRPAAGAGGDVCGFRIQGWGESRATGVDALAALYRALVEIGAQLTQANEAGAQFTVAGPAELGFPAPPTRSDITHDPGMEYELGDLLAIRTLIAADGPHTITIGRPVSSSDSQFYVCPFRIDGSRHAVASGLDEIQALLTAIRMIAAWLDLPGDWPISRLS
ncbi:hypothetical protein SAMN04244553_1521 [Nocardia amikacinitolerans]|uniref:DUF6968 domain-containing protein n=1 Tax=Nocardia amikacinitolerans TaxID=756689 RepID=A0A285L2M7_9NOCA|nr:hypothetical protein [Nocardia amikacinitolerans]MCP2278022.1 hypothetical protein [Nocardia amikacinitolerans]MCP2296597.1 hypothetical protein [Nocardia amikacinitolerans]MCP2321159.1 hypothetical protein [Nocardia amikacinitolerans]SNY79189.1 hypothetical protein SAMN04244553_1521 [Nocardia amikacinitolerans]